MAIKNKTDIKAEINSTIVSGGAVTATDLNTILNDIVDSYEDLIQEYTTVQRDLLTPFEGLKIYNTTSNRMEYYSASQWMPCSQKEVVALDCSGNPNYSEALVGDQYIVSVAGYVGGASGKAVYLGDMVYCIEDNAGGDEATVGSKWQVCHSVIDITAQVKRKTITLTSAQILNINTTPITAIAAVSGKSILVVSGQAKATYNSSTYSGSGLLFITNTAVAAQCVLDTGFSSNMNQSIYILMQNASNDTQMADSEPLVITSITNPTIGDSDITITLFYLEV